MSIIQITITIHYCLCKGEHCSESACTAASSTPLATMSSPPTSTSCSASSHFCLFTKAMTNQIFVECLYPVMNIKSRLRDTSFIYMNDSTKTIKNTSVMNVKNKRQTLFYFPCLVLSYGLRGILPIVDFVSGATEDTLARVCPACLTPPCTCGATA